jgi:CRP-like cAMP-binding protein
LNSVDTQAFSDRFAQLAASAGEGLDTLLGAFEVHDAQAGEALIAEGTQSSDLFLVWDGELDVMMGEQRLASFGPGSLFGEASLFDPGPAGASVVTEQGCVVLRLTRERFDELGASSPAAAAALVGSALHSLAARMRAASSAAGGPS